MERHLFGHTLGEALSELARQKYPRDTAKRIAKAWDLEASTATNVLKGHASERTLAKAFRAEGWPLIAAIGQAVTGESFTQFEERRLLSIISEAEDAHENLVALRTRRAQLESRAAELDPLRSWSVAEPQRHVGG